MVCDRVIRFARLLAVEGIQRSKLLLYRLRLYVGGQISCLIGSILVGWLRNEFGNRPVPIARLIQIRHHLSFFGPRNPYRMVFHHSVQLGERLNNQFLSTHLASMELGKWSLTVDTINYLEKHIFVQRPNLVLEFGSGISTVCLARFMLEIHKDPSRVYVISIEQDASYVTQTEALLASLGLGHNARVIEGKVEPFLIEGYSGMSYSLPDDFHQIVLQNRCPDFVLVDGPKALNHGRFVTLPMVRPFLSDKARFFLDDALRADELDIAERWAKLPYIHIDGIVLVGKGLLTGIVEQGTG